MCYLLGDETNMVLVGTIVQNDTNNSYFNFKVETIVCYNLDNKQISQQRKENYVNIDYEQPIDNNYDGKTIILFVRDCFSENPDYDKNKGNDYKYQIKYSYIDNKRFFGENGYDDKEIIKYLLENIDLISNPSAVEVGFKQALLEKACELDPVLQYQIDYDKRLRGKYEQFLGDYHHLKLISKDKKDDLDYLFNIASNPLIANKISESTREYEELSGDEKYKNAANLFIKVQPPKIADIIKTIGEKRPNYSCDFIKNVLICIAQNFITIFAGQPGTGKTSLCDIIASAFGLDNMIYYDLDMSRYISVSVERGWNSKSELIGYFNALSGRYDDSGIGIYHALKVLHYERNLKTHPFFVLLDEANLSPVEHYWSEFMKLADVSELHKDCRGEIPIGGGEKLKVPNNLRFLATVNNDQTTEPLSPRLIDRTSVIKLPEKDDEYKDDTEFDPNLTWDILLGIINTYANAVAKGANNDNNNTNETDNVKKAIDTMKDVYKAFEDNNLPVSRRIKNRIKVYLKVAVNDFKIDKDKAVDFAIAQNLLPKINGFCEEYSGLCTDLNKIVNDANKDNYPLTYAFLQKLHAMLEKRTNEYIQYTSI